jgi:hypothetical protein
MHVSSLIIDAKAAHGAEPRAAFIEAKGLAARLHLNVNLHIGSMQKIMHATTDIDQTVADYEKNLELLHGRT